MYVFDVYQDRYRILSLVNSSEPSPFLKSLPGLSPFYLLNNKQENGQKV